MFSMSSILSAFKFRGSDDKNLKPPELENSSSELKTQDIPVPKTDASGAPEEKKKPSPCCCCKETKQKRDECIMEYGIENCTELVEAHRVCMKGFGYEI